MRAGCARAFFDDKGRTNRRLAGSLIAAVAWAAPAAAQQIVVPSGLDISLQEVILEADTQTARFRFVVPAISAEFGGKAFGDVVGDLEFVCNSVVVPALLKNGWAEGEVVISVSDQPVDFGFYDAQVTQFFQPFRLQGGACIWEDF